MFARNRPDSSLGKGVRRFLVGWMAAVFGLAVAGCSTVGPRTIPRDHFNYNQAGAKSTREQLLLNIVRLRYGEPLYFLDIGSIYNQYTLEAGGGLSGWENDLDVWKSPHLRAWYGIDSDPSKQDSWGVNLKYIDRPTITYIPLQGEDFANRVMAPIPPLTLIYLSQSGWGIDRLFGCCVQRVNGIRNAAVREEARHQAAQGEDAETEAAEGERPVGDAAHNEKLQGPVAAGQDVEAQDADLPRFLKLTRLLRKIQDAGNLALGVEVTRDRRQFYLYRPTEQQSKDMVEVSRMLGLPLDVTRIAVISSPVRRAPDELAIQTRSLYATLYALSQQFIPPAEHVKDGQVTTRKAWAGAEHDRQWLRIKHSRVPRVNAFVQVYYNGYWFYISKTDQDSKATFALLIYLFSLQSSTITSGLPVVTVPAGG